MRLIDSLNKNRSVEIMCYPFRYGVINNFLNKQSYNLVKEEFKKHLPKAKVMGAVSENSDSYYHALYYTPTYQEILLDPLNLFISKALSVYISGFFGSKINEYIILGMHSHKAPSISGWKHTDFNIVSFNKNIDTVNKNYLTYWDPTSCIYNDDKADLQPNTNKYIRHIACLYYLNNPKWQEGDGGETGIYTAYEKDLPLIAKVPPINNSLLFFEINPLSYHGFIAAKKTRNCLIWWYHTSPAYAYHKNLHLIEYKNKYIDKNTFEWWSSPESKRWSLKNDPNYNLYFK